MDQYKAQQLFDILGLVYGYHSLYEVQEEFNKIHTILLKKYGRLSTSIERIEKGIEDFYELPIALQSSRQDTISELEANQMACEQERGEVEKEMDKYEKAHKDIENLYKTFEPDTYYELHPELKPIMVHVVSPVVNETDNTDHVKDYIPEEIDGTGLIMDPPFVAPKNTSVVRFRCPKCHIPLASQQKLDQHLRKKKKCYIQQTEAKIVTIQNDEQEVTKKVFVCCHCSKQYNQQAGLSRHKQTCNKRLKKTTQTALLCAKFQDDGFELNSYGHEEVHFTRDGIYSRMMCEKYFLGGAMSRIRQTTDVANAYSRKTTIDGVRTKMFNNPNNFTFYLPNIADTQALTYQGPNAKEKVKTMHVNEVVEHILDSVVDSLLDAIEEITEFNEIDEYGDEVNTHHLYKFLIKYQNNEDVTTKKHLTKEVKRLLTDYKDDIKRIWKENELI